MAHGVSLFVNGVDPGFANDALPLVLTGISERIEEVRCSEVLNYNTYNQPMVLFDIMGFGRPMDEVPSSSSRRAHPGLGQRGAPDRRRPRRRPPGVEEWYERKRRPRTSMSTPVPSRRAPRPHCTSRCGAWWATRPSSWSNTSPGCATTSGPSWPQPAGHGCYRVQITGEPNYTLDLQLMGTDGDHNTAGLKATAMRLVNAIPAVIAAEPGIVTALDLPPITGRGLVVT